LKGWWSIRHGTGRGTTWSLLELKPWWWIITRNKIPSGRGAIGHHHSLLQAHPLSHMDRIRPPISPCRTCNHRLCHQQPHVPRHSSLRLHMDHHLQTFSFLLINSCDYVFLFVCVIDLAGYGKCCWNFMWTSVQS